MTQCDSQSSNEENRVNDQNIKRSKVIAIDEIKDLIEDIDSYPLNTGEKWYLVSLEWWKHLLNTLRNGYLEDVKPINCSSCSVTRDGGTTWFLKEGLVERIDFMLLPGKVFRILNDTFGVDNESRDVIERKVVLNLVKKQPCVEIYPKVLKVTLASDRKKVESLLVSQDDTVVSLRNRALQSLGIEDIDVAKIRFYIYHKLEDRYELLSDRDAKQNYEHFFAAGQEVVIDVLDESGQGFILQKARSPSSNGSTYSQTKWSYWSFWSRAWLALFWWASIPTWLYRLIDPFVDNNTVRRIGYIAHLAIGGLHITRYRDSSRNVKGVCGLHNLGNTCFMASAIQCLSNVPPITEYFLSRRHEEEINTKNPLGTHGELAMAYGKLIHEMWSGENSSVMPRAFKMTIGQFAPRFSGYSQQDSQELLAFLLDGLHEDLNRIKVKPYVEEDDYSDPKPDHDLAAIQWDQYKSRNDSIIVDKVHGQIKSTLVCPICQKISIKFDPFCFLSLPLPPRDKISRQTIVLIFNPAKKWARFSMNVNRLTTVREAVDIMKEQLDYKDLKVVFWVQEGSDGMKILDHDDYVQQPNYSSLSNTTTVYASQISADSTEIVVVKNQSLSSNNRNLSLPMIYGIASKDAVTRDWVTSHVIPFTRSQFMKTSIDDNEEMDDADSPPYEIFVENEHGTLSFPDTYEGGNIIVKWKDSQKFNGATGKDLVDRECSIRVRTEIGIMDCIDAFTKEEQLGEQDSWYCPRCKKHQRATKKLDLWKLPEILIVHLKRFQYTRWNREKIDIHVEIPVSGFELNDKLANERHEHVQYDLIAMSHHMGGLGGGHYTASALNPNGKWYDFNDSCVSEIHPPTDPFKAKTPYMLVYRRRYASSSPVDDSNIEMETDG